MRPQKERICKTKGCENKFYRTGLTRMRVYCDNCQKERNRYKGNRTDIHYPHGEYSLVGLGER